LSYLLVKLVSYNNTIVTHFWYISYWL